LNFADPIPQDEARADARVLLRSPTIEGIEAASLLFPDAHLLILVRGGPETVESGRRSFGWGYDDAIRAWRRSARRLLSFIGESDPFRCRLVRFEDLVTDPLREVSEILEFLELDDVRYPFHRIDSVPVLGSSSFGRVNGEPVHWRPVPKTDEFDPLCRAQAWPSRRQKRATWLGGAELARLGYPVQPLSVADHLLNLALDVCHGLRRAILCVARSVQCRPRLFSGRQGLYLTWRHLRKSL
jgi:protein-tyrosine sulfotransferase